MVVLYKRAAGIAMRVLVLITIAMPVHAQKNIYSLNDLADSLQHYLPVLFQKQALVNSAKAGIDNARHTYLPKLIAGDEVSLASANSLPGSYLPLGVIPSISGSIRADNNTQAASGNIASLYGEYQLVDFGLKNATINNAKASADLQQADYEKELYQAKLQLGRLYFTLLKNWHELQIDQQNISRYGSIYSVINALTGSGVRAGVDSSLAKAELSKSRVSYNQRLGAIHQLTQQLSFLTGIPAAQLQVDTTERKYAGKLFGDKSNADNPLLAYYTSQKQFYQSAETLVKKSYLPKIFLAAAGWARGSGIDYADNYQSIGYGLGYQRFNYAVGIAVTYDLFSTIHKNDKFSQSHYQTIASDYSLQQQELSLQNALQLSDENIRVAEQNLGELPLQLQAATEAYDQKSAQFQAGIINLLDLTNAAFVLYTTQNSYIETLNDWFLANMERSAAAGTLDAFIQTFKK